MNTNSYFTIKILTAGTVIIQIANPTGTETPGTIYYWINNVPNAARDNYDGSIVPSGTAQYIRVNDSNPTVGTIIRLYRPETTALCFGDGGDNGSYIKIFGTAETKVSGNMASLIGFSETLPAAAFRYLFYSSNIVDASELELPWDTLTQACFIRLFFNNTKLLYPPKLSATNLAANCYQYMFYGDSSLVKSPELRAKSLKSSCYTAMFSGCTSLNYIVCLAEGTSISMGNFTQNVATTGTFIKHPDATWVSGNSGIPTGWTVKNMNSQTQTIDYSKVLNAFVKSGTALRAIFSRGGNLLWGSLTHEYNRDYLTIECVEDGNFSFDGTWMSATYATYDITLYYSKNGGAWTEIHSTTPTTLSCLSGDKFRFKGINDAISPMVDTEQTSNTFRFTSGDFKVYGNIMSVLFGDNFKTATLTTGTNDYAFKDLFNQLNINNNSLTDVENLILPDVLTPHCFRAMFQYSNISSAPKLPATTLVDYCYYGMFYYCRNLRYIKCSATSGINTNDSTTSWVNAVFNSGTFYKDSSATWPTGNNGIPTTWTAKDIATTIPDIPTITCEENTVTITSNGAYNIYYRIYGTSEWSEYTSSFNISATTTYEAYASNDFGDSNICNPIECVYQTFDNQYFTVRLLDSGSFLWKMLGSDASYTIEYSKNDGSWTSITSDTTGVSLTGVIGDKFRFRGNNPRYTINDSSTYNKNYSYFDFTVKCNIYGNIMSLINGDNFIGTSLTSSNTYAFCSLFKPTSTITGSYLNDASNLILPIGSTTGCFRAMFAYSKKMINGPKEVRLTEGGSQSHVCYFMFQGCNAMKVGPDLPTENNTGQYIYQQMFNGCNSIKSVKCMLNNPTFTTTGTCYRMFYAVITTGTLYKNPTATWGTTGPNGVPIRWTVVDAS